jgi:tetratricopeptide (TPR) repeat protein
MSRKIFRRRSRVFPACFLIFVIALFSFSVVAQDVSQQSQPKQSSGCKPNDSLCSRIERLSAAIVRARKKGEVVSYLYYERAQVYLMQGEYKPALGDAAKCIDEGGYALNCLNLRGSIYLKLAQYEDAFEDFEKAVKLSANNANALYGRGAAYYHKREYELALNDLDRALQLNRRLSGAYYYRALVSTKRGIKLGEDAETYEQSTSEYKKAIEDLTSVIEIDLRKVNPKVFLKRAQLYEALGDTINAEADRKTYAELTKKP